MVQGVPGRLRPRIFLTFSTTRVVSLQPYAPVVFTPGEIRGTHFQELNRPQGTWFRWVPRKKSPGTPPGIDPGIFRLIAQCLNHYATPCPRIQIVFNNNPCNILLVILLVVNLLIRSLVNLFSCLLRRREPLAVLRA